MGLAVLGGGACSSGFWCFSLGFRLSFGIWQATVVVTVVPTTVQGDTALVARVTVAVKATRVVVKVGMHMRDVGRAIVASRVRMSICSRTDADRLASHSIVTSRWCPGWLR